MTKTRCADERHHKQAQGQAVVEFALVAPLLLILLLGIFEAGRYVLNLETLNNATREGARYAIVHGAQSDCPTGPMPGEGTNTCEAYEGADTIAAVRNAAVGLASLGDLHVATPAWTGALSTTLPDGPDDDDPLLVEGDNYRGNFVTVWADYSYEPIIKQIFDSELIPSITISAESTLVINY